MKVKSKIMLEINEIKIRKTIEEKYQRINEKKKQHFFQMTWLSIQKTYETIFFKATQ